METIGRTLEGADKVLLELVTGFIDIGLRLPDSSVDFRKKDKLLVEDRCMIRIVPLRFLAHGCTIDL